MTKSTFVNNPLPVLISSRIRLNEEQRKTLKNAYFTKKNQAIPEERTNEDGLVVVTPYTSPALDKALGMSQLVFSDLINSRDTITIGIILKIQDVLGVEVISKKDVMAACKSYCDYIFTK